MLHASIAPLSRARIARWAAVAGASSVILLANPPPVHAQSFVQRFTLRGELGGGTMLSKYQQDVLRYNAVVQGSVRLGFSLFRPLAIQASFSSWYFPSPAGDGQQLSFTGGLRLEPMVSTVGRMFIDVNAGFGVTRGDQMRFAMDGGVGFEFAISRAVGLGPVVRYGHLFAASSAQDYPSDAGYWTAGLSLALRVPEPVARVAEPRSIDTDRDGIFDADDACPNEAAGPNPDALHVGCPTRDTDRDGISDARDMCPTVPQGTEIDPSRPGCPASDEDHDLVFDPTDRCPTTPQGSNPDPKRPGCPDGDDDTDTVLNFADICPFDARGLHPDPARMGCPMPDYDKDAVPDATDACPSVPGAPSTDPRRNGCPGLVLVRDGMIVILAPVFFETNGDQILRPSFRGLTAVASALLAQPEIVRLGIEGHTDDVGSDEDNLALSTRRAQSVATWLSHHGVANVRIEARGYGRSQPIVPNALPSGRAANRRVEFHILDPMPRNNSIDATGSASQPTATRE